MRSYAATKIGQSDYELVLSVFFSFFLHAAIVVLALILYSASTPKVYIPPFYEVKLVGQPAEIAPAPAAAPAPPLTKAEPARTEKKPQPKVKIAAPKPVIKQLKQSAMPELAPQKKKTARNDEAKPATTEEAKPATTEQAKPAPKETASVASVPTAASVTAGNKTEGVAVSTASGDSKQLSSYAEIIKFSIGRNWNPPPGGKGMKAKVMFKVLRSGRVFGDVNIEEKSGNDYFDMAAKRAILSSSPFPPMPEEFYKQYAEFSVSLEEK
jgi:TonB family protein